MKRTLLVALFAVGAAFFAATTQAQAQATRTWVSGLGDDANPCSRTAPCKTFPGAYSRTAVGGEIDVIDPGGFGTITIGHALTIDGGGGQVSSILASSGTRGVVINAGSNDRVILRNIRINGVNQYISPGTDGIQFNSGLALSVENCFIMNMGGWAINFQPSTKGFLNVSNTVITGNGTQTTPGSGGLISSTTTGVNRISLDNVTFSNNTSGVFAGVNTKMQLTSVYIGQSGGGGGDYGLIANGSAAEINVDLSSISNNQLGGIHATNSGVIRVGNSTITGNNTNGILIDGGGSVQSFGDNRVAGNAGAQAFSPGIVPLT